MPSPSIVARLGRRRRLNRLESILLVPEGTYTTFMLLITLAAVVVYMNNAQETTTFRIKLVGVSLVALLVALGLLNTVALIGAEQAFDDEHRAEAGLLISAYQPEHADRCTGAGAIYRPPAGRWPHSPPITRCSGRRTIGARMPWSPAIGDPRAWIAEQTSLVLNRTPGLNPGAAREIAAQTIAGRVQDHQRRYRGELAPTDRQIIAYIRYDGQALYEVGYRYVDYRQFVHQTAQRLALIMIVATLLMLAAVSALLPAQPGQAA